MEASLSLIEVQMLDCFNHLEGELKEGGVCVERKDPGFVCSFSEMLLRLNVQT
jgi:hypothetical protein